MLNLFKNKKGFTLMEMMIVLAIISFLMLLIVPNASSILDSSKTTSCEVLAQNIEALEVSQTYLNDETLADEIQDLKDKQTQMQCVVESVE